jgi:hypothetical protein
MKIIHSAIFVLLSAVSITSVQARDSFSFGLNIGGYPPPVFYVPPVTFYNPPVVYYSASPFYYNRGYYNSAPVVSYQYYDGGHRGHHDSWGHEGREHGGWGRGHGGRGHDDDDDDD